MFFAVCAPSPHFFEFLSTLMLRGVRTTQTWIFVATFFISPRLTPNLFCQSISNCIASQTLTYDIVNSAYNTTRKTYIHKSKYSNILKYFSIILLCKSNNTLEQTYVFGKNYQFAKNTEQKVRVTLTLRNSESTLITGITDLIKTFVLIFISESANWGLEPS